MTQLPEQTLEEAVAQHMRRDYTALRVDQTVGMALESLRGQNLAEKIVYFYVIDPEGKLVGVMPTRRLLMAQPDQRVADLMVSRVISIPAKMSVLDACEFFVMHRLLAFPVVDEQDRLVGVVDVGLFTDEIFDVSESETRRESSRDIFQLIGVHLAYGRRGSAFDQFRGRFPWLVCNIGGGIACALISGLYERMLETAIVLALFVPVVLTLAEAVSIQSMTITLQALREERIVWKNFWRSLRLELLTAVLLGLASGTVVGLVAWGWKHHALIALTIGLSIACAIVTACLMGVLLPTLVRAVKGDPKIAAGPVVLASADIATLLFYFNLARVLLG